ncbi:MAG: T9SS type A sorting domain-containing protein [candidate division Zixibacteria bacterium]|nr:T9SS type A sorting domain-containing protein [candidate division Zixibacteria bacterium]
MKKLIFWLFLSFLLFPSLVFAIKLEVTKEYEQNLIKRLEDLHKRDVTSPLIKCLTPLVMEINMVKDKVSPQTREVLKQYSPGRYNYFPYIGYAYNTPGGHFRLHYAKSGPDSVYKASTDVNPANGVADYVDRCAEIFDYVWLTEIDTMGYRQPPSDGTNGGGSGLCDIYIYDLDNVWGYGVLGITESESPKTPSWSYTSFIHMNNGYVYPPWYPEAKQYDLMSVTAGHEFFHAIQFGYDKYEGYDPYPDWKPYWLEMSSTWMEDQTFDNVNDYVGYLRFFYRYPWVSLKVFSNLFGADSVRSYHPYASCVFAIYLSEKFGVGVMKDIWEECGRVQGNNTFSAIDVALAPFGANFDSAFKEFLVWNLFTGTRAEPSNYYSEGSLYDTINILTQQKHTTYPVNVASVDSMPENLGSNYVRFTPLSGPGGLDMYFNGADNAEWVVPVIGYKSGGSHLINAFNLNIQGEGNFDFYNWDDYDYIYMIAGVLTRDSNEYNYGYADSFNVNLGVDEDQLPDRMEYILPQNYPNPFNSQTVICYNLTKDDMISITIYNILGQKVKDLFNGYQERGDKRITWDGKDDQNIDLPSGIYFYKVKTKDSQLTNRMMLLK